MKIVKLTEKTLIDGRIRVPGEIVPVPDSFDGGVMLNRMIRERNKARIVAFLRLEQQREAEQDRLPDPVQTRPRG